MCWVKCRGIGKKDGSIKFMEVFWKNKVEDNEKLFSFCEIRLMGMKWESGFN